MSIAGRLRYEGPTESGVRNPYDSFKFGLPEDVGGFVCSFVIWLAFGAMCGCGFPFVRLVLALTTETALRAFTAPLANDFFDFGPFDGLVPICSFTLLIGVFEAADVDDIVVFMA